MVATIVFELDATGRPSTRLFHTLLAGKSGQSEVGGAATTGPCNADIATTKVRQATANRLAGTDAYVVTRPLGDIGRPWDTHPIG